MKGSVVLVTIIAVFQERRCVAQRYPDWAAPYHSMMRAQFPGHQSNILKFGGAPDEDYGDGKIDGEPMFLFHPDDFDYIPVYPGNPNPTKPPVHTTTDKPITNPTDEPDPAYCNYDPSQALNDQNQRINRAFNRRVSDIQCEYNMWNYKYYVLEIERRKNCKYGVSGIFGGSTATLGDFPHMGAIGWRYNVPVNGLLYVFMCGSSLISTKYALTAAHCRQVRNFKSSDSVLAKNEPEIVRFGSVYVGPDKFEEERVNHFLDKKIAKFIYLDNYVVRLKYNDIMLLEFDTDIALTHNIRPACLHTGEITGLDRVNVTGWGRTENVKNSDVLLYAEIGIADRQKCDDDYELRLPERYWRGLQDHQFCAGTQPGVDTCDGDSGGPLQIQEKIPTAIDYTGIMYYIAGVTSFGKNCATSIPGVYTKVSDPNFLCWIEKTVWPDEKNDYYCPGPPFKGYKYDV